MSYNYGRRTRPLWSRTHTRPRSSTSSGSSLHAQFASINLNLDNILSAPSPILTVQEVAKAAIQALSTCGYDAAILGSLASRQYGVMRSPNDVDILVLPRPWDLSSQEDIKRSVVRVDSRFYLRDAKTPGATDKVLYFKAYSYSRTYTKVDLLLPGVMNLPTLPPEKVMMIGDLPIGPFSLLLLTKLQCWDDNRQAIQYFKQQKQYTDASDIEALLRLPNAKMLRKEENWFLDADVLGERICRLTPPRVKRICGAYPKMKRDWQLLGFKI
ncbi:hypothetical protein BT69DRAFT_1270553 [Atractiella rhizophila]|nr:hypothetical protein BT69DRAFT_1270553 [Atractiella rhizophila]